MLCVVLIVTRTRNVMGWTVLVNPATIPCEAWGLKSSSAGMKQTMA